MTSPPHRTLPLPPPPGPTVGVSTIFGQPVDAERLDPEAAGEIGIVIADRTDGDLALDVDWIGARP